MNTTLQDIAVWVGSIKLVTLLVMWVLVEIVVRVAIWWFKD